MTIEIDDDVSTVAMHVDRENARDLRGTAFRAVETVAARGALIPTATSSYKSTTWRQHAARSRGVGATFASNCSIDVGQSAGFIPV